MLRAISTILVTMLALVLGDAPAVVRGQAPTGEYKIGVLEPLIARYLARTTFPDARPILRRLGVSRDALDPSAELARIRDAIMGTPN